MKILTLIIALLIPSTSYAAIVDWTFQGNVTSISIGSSNYGTGLINVGDPWRVNVSIDLNTRNLCEADGTGGVYSFPQDGTTTIGNVTFVNPSAALEMNTQGADCARAIPGIAQLRFFRNGTDAFGFPQPPIYSEVAFSGIPGIAIPTSTSGLLSGYFYMGIGSQFGIGGTSIIGRFTEASANLRETESRTIPEPASLILLTLGLLYGIKSARRHRN